MMWKIMIGIMVAAVLKILGNRNQDNQDPPAPRETNPPTPPPTPQVPSPDTLPFSRNGVPPSKPAASC